MADEPKIACKGHNYAKKVDMCSRDEAGYLNRACNSICYGEKDREFLDDFITYCDNDKTYMVGCIPGNCASVSFENGVYDIVDYVRFNGALARCDVKKGYEYYVKVLAAEKNYETVEFKVCCGVNYVAAVAAGSVIGVLVLVGVALLIWMIVAKKFCFAPKTGSKSATHVEKISQGDVITYPAGSAGL